MTRRRKPPRAAAAVATVWLAGSFAFGAGPARAADAAAGLELARRWCAICHLVAADQERAPTVAPPFASIAKRPDFNLAVVEKSMLAPHPQMPGRELSRAQAADIAAYIATLK